MKSWKRSAAAFMVIAMLLTLALPTAFALGNADSFGSSAGFVSPNSGGVTVTRSEDEQWTFLKEGETFLSDEGGGFSFTANSDVWISSETISEDENIDFAQLFNFEPDDEEVIETEDGNKYTVRTFSSPEAVNKLNAAFSVYDSEVAQATGYDRIIASNTISDEDLVDVIVVLEGESVASRYDITLGGLDKKAANASEQLRAEHKQVKKSIEKSARSFELRYDFTLLINGLAGRIKYGELKKLNSIKGVKYAFVAPSFSIKNEEFSVLEIGSSDTASGDIFTPAMENANTDMNTEAAWLEGYTGKGMTVAIIDSGIDLDHVMLSNEPNEPAMSMESIAAIMANGSLHAQEIISDVTAEQLYASTKIPYGFDYADGDISADDEMGHGSHVAGIVAGSTTQSLIETYNVHNIGVAPDAQLLAMKVFNSSGGASMTDVTAALEDAIILGVDAANLSLGVSCGSVTGYPEITEVFNAALEAGINVAVAAGNDANSTNKSLWKNNLGLASNPDIGVLSMPTTFAAPISVASADNSTYLAGFKSSIDSFTFRVGANNYVYKFSDKSPYAYRFGTMLGGSAWEYVAIDTAAESGYEGVDAEGKIVLAKLSDELSIDEQSRIAHAHGAVGLVLYPASSAVMGSFTEPDTAHEEYLIPVAGMAYFYGNNLATSIIPEKLNVKAYWVSRPDGNQISSFSSWGATNELTLKPDITAIGGSVISSYKDGSVAISSGTSMASPATAGIAVLVRQYLKQNYDLSGKALANAVDSLLMSSAEPIIDVDSGLPFSPRAQGSGLINAGAAIDANAYITVGNSGKAKFELGDDPERTGVYTLNFNAVNLSNEERTYAIDVQTLTESGVCGRVNPDHTYEYLMEQFAHELMPEVNAPESVTVPANSSVNVTITITLSNRDRKYIEKYFENGIYIEGFVNLTAEGEVTLSAPFMGFYGDWSDAPAIETNFFYDWPSENYPASTTLFANSVYTYDENKGETWFIGDTRSEGFGQTRYGVSESHKMMYWDERNAISPNGDGVRDYLDVATGLLRNVKEYRYIITDVETGEELYRKDMGYVPKTYYSETNEAVIAAGMYSGQELDFDWTSLENNQKVIVRIEAVTDIVGNDKIEYWEFPVTCDVVAPLSNIRLYKSGSWYYVQNQMQEDQFVDYTEIFANLNTGKTSRYKVTYGGYDPAGREEDATLGFSSAAIDVVSRTMDYAGNFNYVYISLENKDEMVDLDTEDVTLMEGDEFTINQLYEFDLGGTDTVIDCPLTWTSSDESVVSIVESDMEHAVIRAESVGSAVITATNSFGVSDTVNVNVVSTDDENYAVVTFDAGLYGMLNGNGHLVLEKGSVLSEEDAPEVIADSDHIFWGFDKLVAGHKVKEDVTFTAKYRRNIPVGKTYIETDTIVPGEAYLIAADYRGKTYVLTTQPHIGGEVALKGLEVTKLTMNGNFAIVNDGLGACEWSFETETAGKITNISTGKFLSTIYSQGYAWLGAIESTEVAWSWNNAGGLSHNDAGAGEYTNLSYGLSAAGFDAGFDLFPINDPAYINIHLFKHTVAEDVNTYSVTFVDGLTGDIISEQTVAECQNAELPEAPMHEGYNFLRYDDNGEFITDDITITAEYAMNSYLVTFVDGISGETLSEQNVEYGEAAIAPELNEHEGWHFVGWSEEFSFVSDNITVTAQYERNAYTVSFVDWDDSIIDTQTVLYGDSAIAPADPERMGYTFIGWDGSFENVASDLMIRAMYDVNVYTVSFVDYDGTILSRQYVEYGCSAELPEEPVREFYDFTGWSTDTSNITEDTIAVAQYRFAVEIGDVDASGEINVKDALISMRIAIGAVLPNDMQLIAGDFNGDMRLDSNDALLILRAAMGL